MATGSGAGCSASPVRSSASFSGENARRVLLSGAGQPGVKTMNTYGWRYRLTSALMACLLAFYLVLMPMQQVRAAIPALTAVMMFVKTPFGKALTTSLLIHAGVLAVEFHNTASAIPPTDDTELKLQVKINPKDPMATPAGWTAPAGGNPEPTPPTNGTAPTSTPTGPTDYTCNGYHGATPQAAATALGGYLRVYGQSWECVKSGNAYVIGATCTPTASVTWNAQVATCNGQFNYSCSQAGYSVSGSNCVLSDASLVQKPSDGKAEVKRVSNVLYVDARDTADGLPPGATVTTDTATFVDSLGNKWEYKINADGTSTSTETKPRIDASGKTDVTTTAYGVPNATTGATEVTGYKSEVFTGTGTFQAPTADGAPVDGSGDAKDSTLQEIKAKQDIQTAELKGDGAADMADQGALVVTAKTDG